MNYTIEPGTRSGSVRIPASKSQMHRLLICAALGASETEIEFEGLSNDIKATADCLNALGAGITFGTDRIRVSPVRQVPDGLCRLKCRESGSTLRFMMPVVGALGAEAVFEMEGRLPERPLAPFDEVLRAHGMQIRKEGSLLYCSGKLTGGAFELPGNVSSQYISGLLMALPHIAADSTLRVTGTVESAAYITMTEDALRLAGISLDKDLYNYTIRGGQTGFLPASCRAEGDWSNAAFFLCMGSLSEKGIAVGGLSPESSQGDKGVLEVLRSFGADITLQDGVYYARRGSLHATVIDAAPIPDLIPTLSVVASVAEGETRVINAGRLRLKESDRLTATATLLNALGADITETEDGLIIRGVPALHGGEISSFGDHRIAMSAAVAAAVSTGSVTVDGSECTSKSYPDFWKHLEALIHDGKGANT